MLVAIAVLPLAASDVDRGVENLEEVARAWLRQNTEYISCDDEHFIYGVGYIDGSYMERIFYVRGGGSKPALSIKFQADVTAMAESDEDVEPMPFVLEMRSPEVLFATWSSGSWHVGTESWESALRFKYTSWFGTLSRRSGIWTADWQGYRRPMLPESARKNSQELCELFAAY